MKIGICTIQRDRGPWIKEWVTFHYLMGVRKFYIYLHKCTDNSSEEVLKLKKAFDIECYQIGSDVFRPQLVAYQHAYFNHSHEVDWLAFIDGDEFLYPVEANNLIEVMQEFSYEKISALAIWWKCFGSSGHLKEPNGLIIENYIKRPNLDFLDNKHIKSIVRSHQGESFSVLNNSHYFKTANGTKDELMRNIDSGYNPNISPSHAKIAINHYVCQSLEFFKKFKQNSGSADAGSEAVRPDSWWEIHDINDFEDRTIQRFLPKLKSLLAEL